MTAEAQSDGLEGIRHEIITAHANWNGRQVVDLVSEFTIDGQRHHMMSILGEHGVHGIGPNGGVKAALSDEAITAMAKRLKSLRG